MGIIKAYWLGLRECNSGFGMTYDGNAFGPRSRAYDAGREHGYRWHENWHWFWTPESR